MDQTTEEAGAAIYYGPESFRTTGPKLMGLQSAGSSFLRAMALHGPRTLHCFCRTRENFEAFSQDVREVSTADRPLVWVPKDEPERLADPGILFAPGPGLSDPAWIRRLAGDETFSICGITYTISSDRILDGMGGLFTAPVKPWDAVICISEPTRRAVLSVLGDWQDYYHERFGQRPGIPLQLPVIPLGVHTRDFAEDVVSAEELLEFRRKYALEPDELVVLFVGRLSFHGKANPLPMYLAVERAALAARRRVRLVFYGKFPNATIREAFISGLKQFAPRLRASVLDGQDLHLGRCAWRAADIFCSFSDNIQESFGLTTVEAMAAGLPMVVSDWDGYKDTVIEGENGFRIPTTMPAPGRGEALMDDFARSRTTYDRFIGQASLAVGVDVRAATEAFRRLFEDEGLRRSMGGASRERARKVFDWSVILEQYRELWRELDRERRSASVPAARKRMPGRPDPFRMFASYPTNLLTDDIQLEIGPSYGKLHWNRLIAHPLISLAVDRIAAPGVLAELLGEIARSPGLTLGEVRGSQPSLSTDQIDWSVAVLIKTGFLSIRSKDVI